MFACYKLADSYNIVMEYGNALKYVKIAMLCYGKIFFLMNCSVLNSIHPRKFMSNPLLQYTIICSSLY